MMLTPTTRKPSSNIDRLFHEFFGAPQSPTAVPSADLWEDDSAAHLELDVPGWSMDQLEVTVHQDVVRVRGQRETQSEEASPEVTESTPSRRWFRRERHTTSFERAFRLPFEADGSRVEATLREGVLTVHLPKSEASLPRKIEVRSTTPPS